MRRDNVILVLLLVAIMAILKYVAVTEGIPTDSEMYTNGSLLLSILLFLFGLLALIETKEVEYV